MRDSGWANQHGWTNNQSPGSERESGLLNPLHPSTFPGPVVCAKSNQTAAAIQSGGEGALWWDQSDPGITEIRARERERERERRERKTVPTETRLAAGNAQICSAVVLFILHHLFLLFFIFLGFRYRLLVWQWKATIPLPRGSRGSRGSCRINLYRTLTGSKPVYRGVYQGPPVTGSHSSVSCSILSCQHVTVLGSDVIFLFFFFANIMHSWSHHWLHYSNEIHYFNIP